jgi:cytochrome c oxidase cbb3-type subunit 3
MADKNPYPGANITGHVWDDNLCELTNQPPKWWMLAFHASWIFCVIYAVIYPMFPLASSYTKGLTGWTAVGEYKAAVAEVEAARARYEDKLAGMSAEQMLADPEISEYISRSGKVLFGDKCAACHGSQGQGNPGYPTLLDDDWLFGGTLANIEQSITNGRRGVMPAMGGMQLSDDEIGGLADAIMSGNPASSPLYASKGCIACHGADGKGMAALGSANLTDSIWRFRASDQRASVVHTIKYGVNDTRHPETRNAEMPAFKGKVSEIDIRKLAVYVYKFGGGQ